DNRDIARRCRQQEAGVGRQTTIPAVRLRVVTELLKLSGNCHFPTRRAHNPMLVAVCTVDISTGNREASGISILRAAPSIELPDQRQTSIWGDADETRMSGISDDQIAAAVVLHAARIEQRRICR